MGIRLGIIGFGYMGHWHLRNAPRVEDVPDGWQWYAFKPRKINDSQSFSFASGRFSKGGGRAAVNGVRIDRIEISRVTAPVP